MKKKVYFCNMKRIALLLIAVVLGGTAIGQKSGTGSKDMPDTVTIVLSTPPHYKVQRELRLLSESADYAWWMMPWGTPQLKGGWHVGVDATTFLRDAAFSLPYTRGYTATGFFVTPYVGHKIGSDAEVSFGVHLAGVAGSEGIRQWKPMVRLEYNPHDNVRWVMGSLYSAMSHRLFEPMFDRERFVYAHQEEGAQLLACLPMGTTILETDTWLHWEELLEPWQMTQERFTLGSSNEWTFLQLEGRPSITFAVPFSFLGTHRGGQFSALDTCIESLFNENVGLRANVVLGLRSALAVDVPFFFYQDISPTKYQKYDKGWGLWPQVSYDVDLGMGHAALGEDNRPRWHGSWHLLAQVGYWYGNQFVAPRGSYHFQSVSWHKKDFVAPEREMVTAKVGLENWNTSQFSLGMDAEFYYDLMEKGLDFAFGIYMRYRL